MTERQDMSTKSKDGKILITTVSDVFELVKIETEDYRECLLMDLHEFRALSEWILKKR